MRKDDVVTVFPNPTPSRVTVKGAKNASLVTIEVYNEEGARIETKQGTQVDLSGYEKGVYTLKIITPTKTELKRVVLKK